MATLFNVVHNVLLELGEAIEGKATGGSTSTIVDTGATGNKEFASKEDDYYNGGTAGILYDAGGAAAAPEGEYSEVSDFDQDSKTITVSPLLTIAVAANDRYFVASDRFALQEIIAQANKARQEYKIVKTDTSLSTSTNTKNYTIPTGVVDIRQIVLQDTSGGGKTPWPYWEETPTEIIFRQYPPASRTIELIHVANQAAMYNASDTLDDQIALELFSVDVALRLLRSRKQRGQQNIYEDLIEDLQIRYDRLRLEFEKYVLEQPQRDPSRMMLPERGGQLPPDPHNIRW